MGGGGGRVLQTCTGSKVPSMGPELGSLAVQPLCTVHMITPIRRVPVNKGSSSLRRGSGRGGGEIY